MKNLINNDTYNYEHRNTTINKKEHNINIDINTIKLNYNLKYDFFKGKIELILRRG